MKCDSYLKSIADALNSILQDSKERDNLKARKRVLKAENKTFKKEVASLQARITVLEGFKHSTNRIKFHVDRQIEFFQHEDQSLKEETLQKE